MRYTQRRKISRGDKMNEIEFALFLVLPFVLYFVGIAIGRKQVALNLDFGGRETKTEIK